MKRQSEISNPSERKRVKILSLDVKQALNETIKLLCNWTSTEVLTEIWNKMSKGNKIWNNITMVTGKNDIPDYYVVINKPPNSVQINKKKTLLFRMEPYMNKHPEIWGEYVLIV